MVDLQVCQVALKKGCAYTRIGCGCPKKMYFTSFRGACVTSVAKVGQLQYVVTKAIVHRDILFFFAGAPSTYKVAAERPCPVSRITKAGSGRLFIGFQSFSFFLSILLGYYLFTAACISLTMWPFQIDISSRLVASFCATTRRNFFSCRR